MQFLSRCIRHVEKRIRKSKRKRRQKLNRAHRARVLPEALKVIANTQLVDGLNREPRDKKVILALASFPPRFEKLDTVLKRLLDQTFKPDRLILYLDDFLKPGDVPESIAGLTQYGLEIRYVPHDLKPHKKYFFAMQEFPEDLVITVDDDFIFPRELVETLVASWRRFPDCVSALRAHKIAFKGRDEFRPYAEWGWECEEVNRPSMRYLATGGAGTLYPPHVIPPEGFDIDAIRATSLNNDDLWLKFMEMRTGTKVVICGRQALLDSVEVKEVQHTALKLDNVNRGANDRCIQLLMDREHRTARDFRR
jgi:hypothetical protein